MDYELLIRCELYLDSVRCDVEVVRCILVALEDLAHVYLKSRFSDQALEFSLSSTEIIVNRH